METKVSAPMKRVLDLSIRVGCASLLAGAPCAVPLALPTVICVLLLVLFRSPCRLLAFELAPPIWTLQTFCLLAIALACTSDDVVWEPPAGLKPTIVLLPLEIVELTCVLTPRLYGVTVPEFRLKS